MSSKSTITAHETAICICKIKIAHGKLCVQSSPISLPGLQRKVVAVQDTWNRFGPVSKCLIMIEVAGLLGSDQKGV